MRKKLDPEILERAKTPNKIHYFRFIAFIVLIGLVLFIGSIIEKNSKNQKILDYETKKSDQKPLASALKDQANGIINNAAKEAGRSIDNVLGEATQYAVDTASKSAEAVTDYVFKSTVGSLIKQIEKLPSRQKEEIKKDICK